MKVYYKENEMKDAIKKMPRIMMIFNDEVASYPVEQLCKDNDIKHLRIEVVPDGTVLQIPDECHADVAMSQMTDMEILYDIL